MEISIYKKLVRTRQRHGLQQQNTTRGRPRDHAQTE